MFNKTKQIIGVELGAACLKAAVIEFNEKTEGLLVREYAIQPLEGTDKDLETGLGLLLSKLKTKCRHCAVAAWPAESLFRFFEHDPTGSSDVRAVLSQGAQGGGKEGLDKYVLDFVDTGKGKQSPTNRLYVACGAPRGELESTRDLFRKLQYEIELFQLTPLAVFNAFQSSLDETPTAKTFLSVDFGSKRSSLSGGDADLHLMREIEWGAVDLHRTLVDQKLIQPGQALREIDLPLETLRPALEEALAPLVRQIRFSTDYLRNEVESGYLREIHISGGLSTFDAFVEVLTESLMTPCTKWNPFRRMQATNAALKESGLLMDLFRLQAAAGAAIQYLT